MFDSDSPLGLPKGSIRAIITLLVLCVSLYIYINVGDIPETLKAILTVIITFYFTSAQASGR